MSHDAEFPAGSVWLVGAGPGDPDLLTRKAARLLEQADIVFHDALVGPAILAVIPAHVKLTSVGKRSGRHSRAQPDINALLIEAARAGARVVRLKGGDPSIFGRSAEELDALAEAGIVSRVCPGITVASAAAASAKVSLTLRDVARRLTLLTAHTSDGGTAELDRAALATAEDTLAIYMGRGAARSIAAQLIAAGRDPGTPVLIAVNVSLADERLIHGRLDALGFLVRAVADDAPTLILIGDAVAGRKTCSTLRSSVFG